jgi:hypothetical protein
VLGGWSAGCSGIRARLIELNERASRDLKFPDGAAVLNRLRALVLADGTHASLPPQPWQLDVWRPWIEKARGGEELDADPEPDSQNETKAWKAWLERGQAERAKGCPDPIRTVPSFVFAASHTYQTYVEHLPGGKAYTSTVNVLRELTGWPIYDLPAGVSTTRIAPPQERHEHDLHVESWGSAAIDGPAHIRQQTLALPGMLARYVRPMIEAAIL